MKKDLFLEKIVSLGGCRLTRQISEPPIYEYSIHGGSSRIILASPTLASRDKFVGEHPSLQCLKERVSGVVPLTVPGCCLPKLGDFVNVYICLSHNPLIHRPDRPLITPCRIEILQGLNERIIQVPYTSIYD